MAITLSNPRGIRAKSGVFEQSTDRPSLRAVIIRNRDQKTK